MIKKTCVIKIVDEVNVAIVGLSKYDYQTFSELFAIHAKSYRFTPAYKIGRWDGKIRFFKETGLTYVNLLEDIIPMLSAAGYKLELKDARSPVTIDNKPIDASYLDQYGITLAEHQVEAINAVLEWNSGLVEAGTGAGKSFVNGVICDIYNKNQQFKTITIVPSSDLVTQTKEAFTTLGLDVGEYSGTVKDLKHEHIISTWQALNNNPAVMALFQVVICDEAHLATGASLQSLLNEHGSHIIVRIGLTGTVPKDPCDAQTMRVTLGPVRYKIKASTLIERGWLAELQIRVLQLVENFTEQFAEFKIKNPTEWAKTDYKTFKDSAFPDFTSERSFLYNKKARNNFIGDFISATNENDKGNCLVLVNSIKQGKLLQEQIPGSYFVDGTDAKKDRKVIYDYFATRNDVVVIASFKLAATGLNIPRIFHLFMIDSNKSFTTIIQAIGRGLRKAEDKDAVMVYDICSDLKYSKRHLTERIGHYKDQGYNYTRKKIEYN